MKPVITKPRRPAPPPIRGYAAEIVASLAQKTKFVDPALAAQWPSLAGPDLAAISRPGRMTGGRLARTLEVVVPNGAAAARVQFEAEALRRRLNEYFGPNTIGRIHVRQSGGRDRAERGEKGLGAALERFRSSVGSRQGDGNR